MRGSSARASSRRKGGGTGRTGRTGRRGFAGNDTTTTVVLREDLPAFRGNVKKDVGKAANDLERLARLLTKSDDWLGVPKLLDCIRQAVSIIDQPDVLCKGPLLRDVVLALLKIVKKGERSQLTKHVLITLREVCMFYGKSKVFTKTLAKKVFLDLAAKAAGNKSKLSVYTHSMDALTELFTCCKSKVLPVHLFLLL